MAKKKDVKHKLSASALSLFLKSPKAFYWRYLAKLEPAMPSVGTWDHDKLSGILWSEFVNRFYNDIDEKKNKQQMLSDWHEQTDGWVPPKPKEKLTNALENWGTLYYQMFRPDDGVRGKGKSELFLENERFLGYLDGLSDDGIVHEVKATSRSPQLMNQLWKTEYSLQVKLYCVLAKAKGRIIEYAFKDPPCTLYRAQVNYVTEAQVETWEKELNALADYIYNLGDNPNNYVCNPDQCCLVTRGITSMCSYQLLCEEGITENNKYGFKEKMARK